MEAIGNPSIGRLFFSRFDHVFDDKGRLTLPVQHRDQLRASQFADRVFLGHQPGLKKVSLYPAEYWLELQQLWQDERRFPSTQIMQEAQRMFFANIEPTTVDRLGRVQISAGMRDRAGLGKAVTVAGVGRHLQIWDPQALEEQDRLAQTLVAGAAQAEAGRHGAFPEALRLPPW
ncbi:MAG: hypothetical protein LBU12_05825 [Deltaproteobacteria bacterium]|jgi:MraZ protein|nr:hypothetical protein [Deltaproteobacteria bacterium]